MADPTSVERFVTITGSDKLAASFFLSAAGGDCDAAVSAFFDAGGVIPSGGNTNPPSNRPSVPPTRGPSIGSSARVNTGSGSASTGRNGGRPSITGGVATLSSLRDNTNGGDDDDDEDEDKKPQEYYTGGEKSGQLVQDPHKQNSNGDETEEQSLAERIFETARRRGPRTDQENGRFEENQFFAGAGYRLGDQNRQAPMAPDVVGRRNVRRVLTFYANGFRVDEGPLRAFDDPANEEFLRDVNRGLVPREMEQPGLGDVSITLVDKKNEEFEQKKERVAFTGDGNRLTDGPSTTGSSGVVPTGEVDRDAANAALTLDENRPVANVQVRLSDGTRLVARLNEDHTVGDLRNFVRASRPGVTTFTLSTTFPRKVLEDDAKSIKEEQLKGAVVVQTLK